MRRAWGLLLLLGLVIATGVIAWVGAGTVLDTVRAAGWRVTLLAPLYLLPLTLATASWRALLPRRRRPGFASLAALTWIGNGVNWLLPVGQVGGEVIKGLWASRHGVRGDDAAASVVADKTLQVVTQILFALIGLGLLAWHSTNRNVLVGAAIGTGAFTLGVAGFVALQRRGMFRISARLMRKPLEKLGRGGIHADAHRVDEAVRALYRDRRTLLAAGALRMAFRFALVIETGIALALLGHPAGLAKLIALEALGQTVRAGAFFIPAGIGVQEGAFAALAIALGIPAPVGVALSLCKRARELLVGVPALIVWQARLGRGVSGGAAAPGSLASDKG